MFDKMREDLRQTLTGATVDDDLRARLHADHDEVARLIAELEGTTDADSEMRADLRDELQRGLVAHSKAEETVVYRRLESAGGLAQQTQHATREHAEIDAALHTVLSLDTADPAFADAVKTLKQVVTHHVHEEETNLLPKAEVMLGKDALTALIPGFNDRKRQLIGQLESEQRMRKAAQADDA